MSTHASTRLIQRVQDNYALLREKGFSISIADLISGNYRRVEEYSTTFTPHLYAKGLAQSAKAFAEDYDIWLPQGTDYVTCPIALFPDAPLYRILSIVENGVVDFRLNDTVGRGVFRKLSEDQKREAKDLIDRLSKANPDQPLPRNATPIERANMTVLQKIKAASPAEWSEKFLHLYNYHLKEAHQDCEIEDNGPIPTIAEYCEQRNHISGMPHTVALIEFSTGDFLNWKWLTDIGLSEQLTLLHEIGCMYGCLSNDVFSLEKECIDDESTSNLIAVIQANHPDWDLEQCIRHAGHMLAELFEKYFWVLGEIKGILQQQDNWKEVETVQIHLKQIEKMVQAAWSWQVETNRYKRPDGSIFVENCIKEVLTMA